MNDQNRRSFPVAPLPNPGEGGPVYDGEPDDGANRPVIPLPNPGEGGPMEGGGGVPVIPLPNPGEGGPVSGSFPLPIFPRTTRVRFLNAAFGYQPFRVQINRNRSAGWLNYAAVSPYVSVPIGYQTVTVLGPNGYVYLQKSMPFPRNVRTTIAIINTPSGLDLLQLQDSCCPSGNYANFRVCNLALNSRPLDVLLGDGRVVYADVQYKEATAYKRIRPGAYQFLFAETSLTPMPAWMDIETLDSAFLGMYPVPNTVTSLYLSAVSGVNYTVFLLPAGPDTVQALLTEN